MQKPFDVRTLVAQADLIAQGLMTQESGGLILTGKGALRAYEKLNALSMEDQLLIMGLIRGLVYKELRHE
jgi:hypothetical protein